MTEVERANAIITRVAAAFPIHGQLRQVESNAEFPLITCGLHCTACNVQVGGALDLSGELGPTDGRSAAVSLFETLSSRGCSHAREVLSSFARFE